jgi:hypothetical protein
MGLFVERVPAVDLGQEGLGVGVVLFVSIAAGKLEEARRGVPAFKGAAGAAGNGLESHLTV